MHVSHATRPRQRWTRRSQRHLTLSGPPPLHSSHSTWACRARRLAQTLDCSTKRKKRAYTLSAIETDLSGEKLLIGTSKRHVRTLSQASNLLLWSGAVYWKTIMRAWAGFSRRAIGHWRGSPTRLTFYFSKSLWVKKRGQHWVSSVLGEATIDKWAPLLRCVRL